MKGAKPKQELSARERAALLAALSKRFAQNPRRHSGIDWATVKARLEASPGKLRSLHEMERSGGEPERLPGLN